MKTPPYIGWALSDTNTMAFSSSDENVINVHKNEGEEESIPYQSDDSDVRPSTDWSKTPNELRFTSEVVVKRLYALARVMHDTLTNTGICYWTSAGTTLGCVRHQGLVPWDDDIDLCIYQKDEAKLEEAKRLLNYNGFDIIEGPPGVDYKAFHKTDSEILPVKSCHFRYPFCDIFVMIPEGVDKCAIRDEYSKTLYPEEFYYIRDINNMEQRPFGNLSLNCPANAEDYLCRSYGKKWRTEGATHDYDHFARRYVKPVTFQLGKEHYT